MNTERESCTARAPEFLLPLWTPGRAEFEKPIFEDAVRGVGQGQSEVASVGCGCHAFGSQPVFDLPARVPVGRDEGSRSGLRGDARSAAARPHHASGNHQKEQTRARQHDCDEASDASCRASRDRRSAFEIKVRCLAHNSFPPARQVLVLNHGCSQN